MGWIAAQVAIWIMAFCPRSELAVIAVSDVDALIESSRFAGRSGYNKAATRTLGFCRWLRIGVLLHDRLRLSGPRAKLTATRSALLRAWRLILRDLHCAK